ncbi:hypothetical protein [Faecalibacter bovis]|uniref:LPXTG cell wall anchor domain-containing protein n=1 Tax=Faecalibacter bovis TaxID=2898187 RepID=A0ABX7XA45_9FLAO|nr:hypothetical protein [Faecalibacter bovis]QTV04768.1 hypothetical protein J9309_08100 [Faecalibacter bovis]
MKLFQIVILLSSINLYSNDLNNVDFAQNNPIWSESTENPLSENPTPPPTDTDEEPTVPISNYQYALLASAIGFGVYGFFKHKKVKTI